MVDIRTAYDEIEDLQPLDFIDPETGEKQISLTLQSESDATDINKIVERFAKTGILPTNTRGQGLFIDVSDAPTFQEAMHIVQTAQNTFAELPSQVRSYFDNDPAKFLEEFEKGNTELFASLGLTEAKQTVEEPSKTET